MYEIEKSIMSFLKRLKKRHYRYIVFGLSGMLVITGIFYGLSNSADQIEVPETPVEILGEEIDPGNLFGFSLSSYTPIRYTVKAGETFGAIMARNGIRQTVVSELLRLADGQFNPKKMRSGDAYWVLSSRDSLKKPMYFIYESSNTNYLVFSLVDSLSVELVARKVTIKQRTVQGSIENSLYESLTDQSISPEIAVRLSEIYAWTIDFFRLQKGDRYELIFEERYVDDSIKAGTGKILAARFVHRSTPYYAFHFADDTQGISDYYSEEGEGLKRMFLKAPLEFFRITSRYSKNRFHPVQKRWKAHLGTDYAAPTGTPILATASGTVTAASYTSANGNYVKIKHNNTYSTQYLHMSRRGEGMRPGKYVEQGEVIGYVGSTGLATGPHVCYRFWKNGVQVDPLNEPMQRTEPLPADLLPKFKDRIAPLKKELHQLAVDP